VYSRKEEPNPMAPMGVSPPIGLTNHGEVEPLGLLCVECYSFAMFRGTEVVMRTERVSSAVLIASIRVEVIGIETPGKNDASGPDTALASRSRAIYMCWGPSYTLRSTVMLPHHPRYMRPSARHFIVTYHDLPPIRLVGLSPRRLHSNGIGPSRRN
jgi:hypothetical protein